MVFPMFLGGYQKANPEMAVQSALNFSIVRNYWLLGGLILGKLRHFLFIYTESLNRMFHTVPIPPTEPFLIDVVASLVLSAEEIREFVARRYFRHPLNPASP